MSILLSNLFIGILYNISAFIVYEYELILAIYSMVIINAEVKRIIIIKINKYVDR